MRACRTATLKVDALESRRLLTFGELEPVFGGGDGLAPTGGAADSHFDIAALPDGRYYTISQQPAGASTDLLLRRYRADGSLDISFAASGSTLLPLPGSQDIARVTLDAAGAIVVATNNSAGPTSSTTLVVRVLPSGLYDTSFASIGYRTVDLGADNAPIGVATFGSSIVLAGVSVTSTGVSSAAFARLLGNGTPDPSFSGDGIATASYGVNVAIEGMTVQPDGKIVAVGRADYASLDSRMLVHRLNVNGTSDATFGTGGGWREFDLPSSFEALRGAAVWGDRLYLVGDYEVTPGSGQQRGLVIAMNVSTGSVDTSFNPVFPTPTNGNGFLSFSFDPSVTASSALATEAYVASDGRLLVGGIYRSTALAAAQVAMVAITPAGSLDVTFDGDGRRVLPTVGENLFGMDVTADQSVLLLSSNEVARLRGMLDLAYGMGGTSTLNVGGRSFIVVATHALPDGKTLAALSSRVGDLAFYVARFNANGSLDDSFGNANPVAPGLATLSVAAVQPGDVNQINTVDMVVEPDGQIVLAGTYARLNSSFAVVQQQVAVARFNDTGSVDLGFGTNGITLLDADFDNEIVTSVALAPDGDILVGGYQGSLLADVRPFIVRLTSLGTRDTSFDFDGVLSPLFNTISLTRYNTRLMDLVVRPNGNIVYVGGWQSSPTGSATANGMVVELLPTGAPNPDFGFGGFGDAGTGSADRLFSVAIQPDGKIVAAGHFAQVATVIRVNANGFYDGAFGAGGIATGPGVGNGLFDVVGGVDLIVSPNSRIVVSAITTEEIAGLPGESAIWRLNADGSVDKTFQPFDGVGELGKPFNAMIFAIAQQADGKVILGGTGDGLVLRRTSAGQFQTIDARYMINGYNGVGTYPTWRVRFTEPVDFTSVAATDFNVAYRASSTAAPTTVPSTQLAWQTTADPREIDLYYTGPNGVASFVWPKGFYTVDIVGGAIRSAGGAAVAASPPGFSTFRSMPGDFNDNGTVNFDDLLLLAANYNLNGRTNAQGDATYDGQVNFDDLLVLAANYNQTLAAPGPATLLAPPPPPLAASGDDGRNPDRDTVLA